MAGSHARGEWAGLLRAARRNQSPEARQALRKAVGALAAALTLVPAMKSAPEAHERQWFRSMDDLEDQLQALKLPWRDQLVQKLEEAALPA